MGSWVSDAAKFVATMVYKSSLVLSCVLSSLVLLSQPDSSSSAPAPRPAPAPVPFTPGIKIGALLGAGLVLKAYLLSQALAGDGGDSDSSYTAPIFLWCSLFFLWRTFLLLRGPPILQTFIQWRTRGSS